MSEPLPFTAVILISGGASEQERSGVLSELALRCENIGIFVTMRPLAHYGHDETGVPLPGISDYERRIARTPGFMVMLNAQQNPIHLIQDVAADHPAFSFDCGIEGPDHYKLMSHFGPTFEGAALFKRNES